MTLSSSTTDSCERDTTFPRYCFTTWRTLSTHTRVDYASRSIEHRLCRTTKKLGESSLKQICESREDWREERIVLSSPALLSRLSDFNVGSFSEIVHSRTYSIGRRPPLRNPLSGFLVDSLDPLSDNVSVRHSREIFRGNLSVVCRRTACKNDSR